jgi:N-acetylglucosaminyl-diphospho-decaprenol L-rhamnosyltransferase
MRERCTAARSRRPEMDDVTAVVLNWRTPELALRARDALVADGLPPERVLLVDNHSDDDSLVRFAQDAPGSPVLALQDNLGFARANNAGTRALPAERAYLFVNSDAFVHRPGSTRALVDAVSAPGVGIAAPRLLNEDLTLQRNVVPLSAPLPELVRASGLSRWVPDRWQPSLAHHWSHDRSRPIQSAIGAVIAVGAEVWDAVGGFDERIFMYSEDHDLFRRVQVLGWQARFVAEAEFVHLGGASTTQRWGDAKRAERVARADATMIAEHFPKGRARLTIGVMALGVGARAVVRSALGQREAGAVLWGWCRGYVAVLRRLSRSAA